MYVFYHDRRIRQVAAQFLVEVSDLWSLLVTNYVADHNVKAVMFKADV